MGTPWGNGGHRQSWRQEQHSSWGAGVQRTHYSVQTPRLFHTQPPIQISTAASAKAQGPLATRLLSPEPPCTQGAASGLLTKPEPHWPSARMRSSPPRPLWELGTPHPGRPGRRCWLLGWPCRQSLEKFWGGRAGWVPSCPVGPWPAPQSWGSSVHWWQLFRGTWT